MQWLKPLKNIMSQSSRRSQRRRSAQMGNDFSSQQIVHQSENLETRKLLTATTGDDTLWGETEATPYWHHAQELGSLSNTRMSTDGGITSYNNFRLYRFTATAGQTMSASLSTEMRSSLIATEPGSTFREESSPFSLRLFGPADSSESNKPQHIQVTDLDTMEFEITQTGTYYLGVAASHNRAYDIETNPYFRIDLQVVIGSYTLEVVDLSQGNIIETSNLTGARFHVGERELAAGGTSPVEYEVLNTGHEESGRFRINFYASDDSEITPNDRLLTSVFHDSIAGRSYGESQRLDLTLPEDFEALDESFSIGMIIDSLDEVAESDESDNSNVGQLVDTDQLRQKKTPGQAHLNLPRTLAEENPTIVWDAIDKAGRYELWVTHMGSRNRVIHNVNVTGNSFTYDGTLAVGTYRVWVRAGNAGGWGAWSTSSDFSVGQLPASPPQHETADSMFVENVQLQWSQVDHATSYELWVENLQTGEKVIHETDLADNLFVPEASLPTGRYRVWVRAANEAGSSEWTPCQQITIWGTSHHSPPPVFTAETWGPNGFHRMTSWTSLDWEAFDEADAYEYRLVSSFGDTSEPITGMCTTPTLSQGDFDSLPVNPEPGIWHLQVRAVTDSAKGEWSDSLSIYIPGVSWAFAATS